MRPKGLRREAWASIPTGMSQGSSALRSWIKRIEVLMISCKGEVWVFKAISGTAEFGWWRRKAGPGRPCVGQPPQDFGLEGCAWRVWGGKLELLSPLAWARGPRPWANQKNWSFEGPSISGTAAFGWWRRKAGPGGPCIGQPAWSFEGEVMF